MIHNPGMETKPIVNGIIFAFICKFYPNVFICSPRPALPRRPAMTHFFMPSVSCATPVPTRTKDWINNCCGGAAAGFSVALLSKHTRSPRVMVAHAAGGAAITSIVALLANPSGGGGGDGF